MLLLFSTGAADYLKNNCCISVPFALKGGVWGLSLRKSSSNQFNIYVFPELKLVFTSTSFPFGFDARLLGLIVTLVSYQFFPKDTRIAWN